MSLEKRQHRPNSIAPSSLRISASSPRTLFRVQASSQLRRHMAILTKDEVAPTIIRLDDSDLAHTPCEMSLSVHSEAESIATTGQKPPRGASDASLSAETPGDSKGSPIEQLSIADEEGVHEPIVGETGGKLAGQQDDVGSTLTLEKRAFSNINSPPDAPRADAASALTITPTAGPLSAPGTNLEVVIIDLDSDDDDNPSGNEGDLSNDGSREAEGSASVLGKRKAQLLSDDRVDAEATATSVAKTPRISTIISPATGSQHCPVELDSDSDVDSPPSPRQPTTSISSSVGVGSTAHQPIVITIENIMSDDEPDTRPELEDEALQCRISESSRGKSPLSPTKLAESTGSYLDQLGMYQSQQREQYERQLAKSDLTGWTNSRTSETLESKSRSSDHDIVVVPSFQKVKEAVPSSKGLSLEDDGHSTSYISQDAREDSSSPCYALQGDPSPMAIESMSNKSSDGFELSNDQLYVIDEVVRHRKNVFFTGSAGTGKSVLLRELIVRLRARSSRWGNSGDWDSLTASSVAVTASTGIAACNIGGCTLHSFAGIGLGQDDFPLLSAKVKSNQQTVRRWKETTALVVDEVSMIDAVLMDKLEHLARYIRESDRPWGGIQVVMCGDFFQLPPVDKTGNVKFCFESESWARSIHATIQLEQIFRQKDSLFANMLNQIRIGRMSPSTITCFRSLSRPLQQDDGLNPTDLFPLRKQVEEANATMLRKLPGDSLIFEARDRGKLKNKMEQNCVAPTKVEIRVNAQVMLLRNQSGGTGGLVNGSIGTIIEFTTEPASNFRVGATGKPLPSLNKPGELLPRVRFVSERGGRLEMIVGREEWTLEKPGGEFLGGRVQIPLCLAWALSIHKSQGQTLPKVRVDLGRGFEKGQAYVALSRAMKLDGLQVLNFDPCKVMVHPKVVEFYDEVERRKAPASED